MLTGVVSEIKVYYFDAYWRGECLRMLLSHKGVNFEDVVATPEQFGQMKAEGKLEFEHLPALEVKGKFYCETKAILRYLGGKYGYYPMDAKAAWRVDSIIDALGDAQAEAGKVMQAREEEKAAVMQKVWSEVMPKILGKIDKILAKNSTQECLVGTKETTADFFFGGMVFTFWRNPNNPAYQNIKSMLDGFPNVKKWADAFEKKNATWLNKRKQRPF
mmetsp:Transcript_36541/g.27100  ORF Transcript_36541/g.27100 Transcript_36541/m.27100 type:complete len:217 (-) Transcript_36541:47-697(-)